MKPAGGTILSGDYDLVRWENGQGGAHTSRTIRVFGAGSYLEWDAYVMGTDGGFADRRYDTRNTVSGHTFKIDAFACGPSFTIYSYGYTTIGDDLTFFDYDGLSDGNANVISVDVYRRTCTRP